MAQSMGFPLVSGCVTRNQCRGRTQTQTVQTEDVSASQENITVFWVSELREGMQRSDAEAQDNGRHEEWRMNPHHSSILGLNCMCLGRHMSPMKLHALHQAACSPFQELRIKTYLSHHFGIIINYYSQGLKPLSLAPLSNLSAPFPLPTLWKLSPPSLFLRGRSARNDV
jgi:hypothetical protein